MNPENCVFSVTLGIRRDHRRRRIEMNFCVVAGLQEIVLRFDFHQNRLSRFGALGAGRNLPFAIHVAESFSGKTAKSVGTDKFRPLTDAKPLKLTIVTLSQKRSGGDLHSLC